MTAAARMPALVPGDRVPNLTLPDLSGRTRKLYHEVSGGPIMVVTAPDPSAGSGRAVLDGLTRRAAALSEIGAHRFVLTRRPPEVADDSGTLVWIDPYGAAMELFLPFREGGVAATASVAVLDANQRMVAIFTAEDTADPVADAMRVAESVAAAGTAGALDLDYRAAPMLGLARLLPGDLRTRLAALPAGDQVRDPELKRDVAMRLGARIGHEVRRVFQFRPVLRFEPFRIVDAAGAAAPVRGASEDDPRRRFVVLVGLTAMEDRPGVVFPEYGPHRYRLAPGGAIVFSSELLYRMTAAGATPVLTTQLAEPPAST